MLSRIACTKTFISSTLLKSANQNVPRRQQIARKFAEETKFRIRSERTTEKMTLRERAMIPAGPNAFAIGKGALAGGSVLGIGAICFYGMGLGSGTNTLQNSHLWPRYVKARIQDTYMYFGASIGITAASAIAAFRTPAFMNFIRHLDSRGGIGTLIVGGPIMLRAAWYTAGVVGGLSTIAVCAPSEKFLTLGGPLAMGLGVVIASSLAGLFLPASTALGAGLASLSLYGSLILFSGFLLYDTQKIIKRAENQPLLGPPFDPVNNSISIYIDTLNIFVDLVKLLSGDGKRQK